MSQWRMPNSRQILADNLNALLDFEHERPSQLELRARAKAKGLDISQSTFSRIFACKVSIDLSTLDNLGTLFDIEPWRLVAPHMGGIPFHQLLIGGKSVPGPVPDARVGEFISPAPPATPAPRKKRRKTTTR